MAKKRKKIKGSALGTILIITAVAVVAVAAYIILKNGIHIGGGKGDSVLPANADAPVTTVSETEATTTASALETKAEEYIEVTVHENEYIFDGKVYELYDLVELLKSDERGLPVKALDDNASKNAYTRLIDTLKEADIPVS